jgi:hypothetical protein
VDFDADAQHAHFAELQQRWHGWGSPVGVGVLIASIGLALSLISFGIAELVR